MKGICALDDRRSAGGGSSLSVIVGMCRVVGSDKQREANVRFFGYRRRRYNIVRRSDAPYVAARGCFGSSKG